jgi:predicted RNase H-like nuclease (RuvC/YqgF family)
MAKDRKHKLEKLYEQKSKLHSRLHELDKEMVRISDRPDRPHHSSEGQLVHKSRWMVTSRIKVNKLQTEIGR